MSILYIM
ncbi:hypothetical protein VTH06DRAFT_4761 [Thermothelomyces fergusii]